MKCDFLQTRILSVFNLLKRVGFAVLCCSVVNAQPQAPIVWGDARLLLDASDEVDFVLPRGVAKGDTIILAGLADGPGTDVYAMITISANNGASWSPWHTFSSPGWVAGDCWPVITSNMIYAGAETANGNGLYRTPDLGETWLSPLGSRVNLSFYQVLNDTIFAFYSSGGDFHVTWTADGGATFAPGRRIEPYTVSPSLAVSSDYVHVTVAGGDEGLFYSRAPKLAGPFEAPYNLNPQLFITQNAALEFDTSGVGVVGSIVFYTFHPPTTGALYSNTSSDEGENWTAADTVVAEETAHAAHPPVVKNSGSLWAVCWYDTTVSTPFTAAGFWVRYSANRGRAWYPIQQVCQTPFFFGIATAVVDIRPEYIRLYGTGVEVDGEWGVFYYQWEGQIHADTTQPELSAAPFSELLPTDTSVILFADADDNDSLWLIQLVLRRVNSEDSVVIDLRSEGDNTYSNTWQTPTDTSEWTYYYRAEDMWENVTTTEVQTVYVGAISHAESSPLIAVDFLVSVSPNPFNSTLSISLDVPLHQEVTLSLYDLLGRKVDVVYRGRLSSSTISYVAPSSLSSGVYFLRAVSGKRSELVKVALVK